MDKTLNKDYYCEVVGIFPSIEDLNNSVDELFLHGFNHSELSVLATKESVEEKLGKNYNLIDLENNLDAPKEAFYPEENIAIAQGAIIAGLTYIGSISAISIAIFGGGPMALAAIAAGGSTAIGLVLAKLLGKHHADYLEVQLEKGGLLLWVHLIDLKQKEQVSQIMKKNLARDVHLHCY